MKFKLKALPQIGDYRRVVKFAFLPITINQELRWLEKVSYIERCTYPETDSWIKECWYDPEICESNNVIKGRTYWSVSDPDYCQAHLCFLNCSKKQEGKQ